MIYLYIYLLSMSSCLNNNVEYLSIYFERILLLDVYFTVAD